MGLENITRKIVSDADEFAETVIAEAELEAKAITDEYESSAEKEYNQIVDAAYEKASEIMHRANAQSMKEKRVNILATKWEYLDNAFSAAVKLLVKMPEGKQVRLLVDLIHRYANSDAEAIFNKADHDHIGKTVVKQANTNLKGFKIVISDKVGDFSGGLILKHGGVETNLTYDILVASNREQLEDEVSAILFGQE